LRIQLVSAPSDFGDALGTMPEGVKQVTRGDLDFAMVFVRRLNTADILRLQLDD
jgi:hypothetical protein